MYKIELKLWVLFFFGMSLYFFSYVYDDECLGGFELLVLGSVILFLG